jgi:hypothetical protein
MIQEAVERMSTIYVPTAVVQNDMLNIWRRVGEQITIEIVEESNETPD